MRNHGNFIVSLGAMCAWLAPQAEAHGVDVFPGFAAADNIYNEDGSVAGVRIGDMGVAKDGTPRSEEHTSELQSLMRISYAVFCLKKKKHARKQEAREAE